MAQLSEGNRCQHKHLKQANVRKSGGRLHDGKGAHFWQMCHYWLGNKMNQKNKLQALLRVLQVT